MTPDETPAPAEPGNAHASSLRAVWPAILGLSVVFLVEMLDNSVLTVALPTIARDLHASATDLQWVVTGYSLVFGGLMMALGALADRYGARRSMLLGLSVFGLASLAVLLVQTPAELVAVRMVAGAAAAMTAPGTMALCFRLFDSDGLLIRATTAITTVGLVGLAAGPTLGGLVLQVAPWQVLLVANVPVAVLAIACIRFGIPADRPRESDLPPLDLIGGVLGTGAIVLLLWTATLAVEDGWALPTVLAGAAAIACAVTFVRHEQRTAHPLFDLGMLKLPTVGAGLAYETGVGLGMAAIGYTVTLQLQLVRGWSPAEAALGNLPQVLTLLAVGPFVERFVDRVTAPRAARLAAVTVIAGMVVYALLGRHAYLWIALALVLVSAGMRIVLTVAGITVVRGLPEDRVSTGAALSDTSQEIASTVGLAVTGTIIAAAITGPLTDIGTNAAATAAFQHAVTVSTLALAGVGALLVVLAGYRMTRVPPLTGGIGSAGRSDAPSVVEA